MSRLDKQTIFSAVKQGLNERLFLAYINRTFFFQYSTLKTGFLSLICKKKSATLIFRMRLWVLFRPTKGYKFSCNELKQKPWGYIHTAMFSFLNNTRFDQTVWNKNDLHPDESFSSVYRHDVSFLCNGHAYDARNRMWRVCHFFFCRKYCGGRRTAMAKSKTKDFVACRKKQNMIIK